MKKLKQLPQKDFLRLLFAFLTVCFLITAFVLPDRGQMAEGLWRIVSSPCKVSTSYFWLDPDKEAAREYVIALALECAQMGFDELLLEEMR